MSIEKGDHVEVDYTGKLKDGTVFDSSIEKIAKAAGVHDRNRKYQPLAFRVGGGKLIPGFEKGVLGMESGQKKTVEIPPEEAYGKSGNHPLAGKTLFFELEVKNVQKGVKR